MAVGKYQIVVDWNNDGDYDDTYDDITSDVLTVSWFRGRDYASQLRGNSIAGRMTILLKNDDGKYSPSNTSGVLTGSLVPGRSAQLRAGEGLFPYDFPILFEGTPRWTGKIERIEPTPNAETRKTCTIECFGILGYLNDFKVSLANQTNRRTDQAIGDILDGVGWPSADRDLETGKTTISRFWVHDKNVMSAILNVEEVEAGFIKESADGKIVFENRDHRLVAEKSTTSQATFSDASDATNTYITVEQDDPLSTVTNHIETDVLGYSIAGSASVAWTHPESGSSSPTLAPAESKTFEANFPNPSTTGGQVEIDAWTTPSSGTDYTANTASDGSGTNVVSSIGVSVVKTAQRMAMTFTNNGTVDAFLTKIQGRGTVVTVSDPVTIRAIDTDSQAIYGERMYVAATPFFSTSTEAQDWVNYQISIYESPVEILTMVFNAARNDNVEPALAADISDRVTIVGDNTAKLGISGDFFIESVRHKLQYGTTDHFVTWELSPATGGYAQFWVLGTSVLGTQTVPAF